MAQIRNLHWWTVEYGLIGTVKPQNLWSRFIVIYRRERLLHDRSSKENSYDISAAQQSFDITKLQPQLYVTPHLPI
jgi:phenylalanine-4-hydroxylase